jgi:hypothetical protein
MNTPIAGSTALAPTRKVVSQTERSLVWMITAGKSNVGAYASCPLPLKL